MDGPVTGGGNGVQGDERPVTPHNDGTMDCDDAPGNVSRIEFAAQSKNQKGNARRVRINALYFAALGVWALCLAATGEPVYGILAALVLFELALAFVRVSGFTGSVIADATVFDRVSAVLADLCTRANIRPPRVALRDDTLRAAMVRRRKGKNHLVLSRPYVQEIDDPQLRGILAHELIHLVHDDLLLARLFGVVAMAGGFALGIVATIAAGYAFKNLPIFLAAFAVGAILFRLLLSPVSRWYERRADREGAVLCGDPQALADALKIAHERSTETKALLYGPQPWRWLLSPVSWRMPTHPKMADRIARLEQGTTAV